MEEKKKKKKKMIMKKKNAVFKHISLFRPLIVVIINKSKRRIERELSTQHFYSVKDTGM